MLDGWPVLFLISGLIQMEGNPSPATLFTLDSLSIVHGIDLVFFSPPISLLVQLQKISYHLQMLGHALPSSLPGHFTFAIN